MQMMTRKEVTARIKLGQSAIYKRMRLGTFPRPIKYGYAVRWKESEVNEWLDSQTKAA